MNTTPSSKTLRVLLHATRLGASGFAGYPGKLLDAVSPLARFLPVAERREFAGAVAERLTRGNAATTRVTEAWFAKQGVAAEV